MREIAHAKSHVETATNQHKTPTFPHFVLLEHTDRVIEIFAQLILDVPGADVACVSHLEPLGQCATDPRLAGPALTSPFSDFAQQELAVSSPGLKLLPTKIDRPRTRTRGFLDAAPVPKILRVEKHRVTAAVAYDHRVTAGDERDMLV